MEFLFGVFDRLLEVPLIERIRLEGIEDEKTLALKDGALISLIRLGGCRGMPGPEELSRDIEAIRVALSPYLSRPGHAIEFNFARDPVSAERAVEEAISRCRNRAGELGLDLGPLLDERQQQFRGKLVCETGILVVHTRSGATPVDNSAGPGRKNRTANCAFGEQHARHMSLTDALCRALRARNMDAAVLGACDALQEIYASLYPAMAAWKHEWTPLNGQTEPAKTGVPVVHLGEEPVLCSRFASSGGMVLDRQTVAIGDAIISAVDVVVAPEIIKPFNELVDAVTSAPEPVPWRFSFLLEPGGLRSVRLKEQYARLLTFAAPVQNRRLREAVEWLREIDGSGDTVIRLRMSLATWALAGCGPQLRRSAAMLGRAAEQWGNLSVDGVSGDPLATSLATVVSMAPDSTAPVAAAPLSHALALMPLARQASPWNTGAMLFRTDDGRIWPYSPGSSKQNSWVEIYIGGSGLGKSVAMNAVNLAAVLAAQPGETGTPRLPRMAILDIGHSSKGFVDLLKDSLPAGRRQEVAHLKLKMTPDLAINPFDTPPGMRAPYAAGRSFLVNFLSLLAGAEKNDAACPVTGLAGAVVDEAYRRLSDAELPKRYLHVEEPEVDEALSHIGFSVGDFTTWWQAADALFATGKQREAAQAQLRAVPVLADLIDASHAGHVTNLYGDSRAANGEPVLQLFRRSVSEAVRDLPLIANVTRFSSGFARIVALDLDEVVAAKTGGGTQRQASLMFMIARQSLVRDWLLDASEAAGAEAAGILPQAYLKHHLQLAELGRRTPKLLAMDEFHRCGALPGFKRQILQDIREGRKHNIRIALSSQLPEDFGNEILEAASSVFMFGAPSGTATGHLASQFGLTGREQSILKTELTGPGRYGTPFFAIVRHREGTSKQKLNVTLGAAELWALSTTPEDVALRERLYQRFGVRESLLILAARFPLGSAKAEIERKAAQSLEEKGRVSMPTGRAGIIETLADELIDRFWSEVKARAGPVHA